MKQIKLNYGWFICLFVFICNAFSVPSLNAGTKALWKLDYSPFTGMNARCLVDPSNDMDVIIQAQQKEPPSTRPPLPSGMTGPWSPLPPNPDTTQGLLGSTECTNAIYYIHGILFSSTGVVSTVNSAANSFTIEGWQWRQNWYVPPIGGYTPFMSLGNNNAWRFFLYNLNDTNNLYFAISDYRSPNIMTKLFPNPVAKSVLFNKWCHYALVYNHEGGGGLGTWEFFINSYSHGIVTNVSNQAAAGSADCFYLGGDGYNSQYFNAGAYSCWRISDEALTTNEFLNSGTASFESKPETLAFYRLDVNDDNSFDLSNRVANAHHLQTSSGDATKQVSGSTDQAASSVPSPDTSDHFLGDRTLNQGSITFRTATSEGNNSYLISSDGLGYSLGTNSAWTIETWINFAVLSGRQIIFDVKAGGGLSTGWMFMNRNTQYCLYIGNPPGAYLIFPGSTGSETSLSEWHHLALTFDPAAGPGYQGSWECFLDSMSLGTVEYSNSYQRVNSSENFIIGGRASTYSDAVYGSMDLVRVTQGILATNQFLNAGGYVATTSAIDTIAYWKLDSNGIWTDTSSQVDSRYSLNNITNATVSGSSLQCRNSILNPDESEEFIGTPSSNTGSVLINNRSALAVGNLGSRLELDRAFTVEGWMKWNNNDERETQVIAGTKFDTGSGLLLPPVGTANRLLYQIPSGWLLTLEKSGTDVAFHIACNTILTNDFSESDIIVDSDLASLAASAVAGRWNHVALTYEPYADDAGRWTLYLNGEAAGTAYNSIAPFYNHESHYFLLGGQKDGETSFDGYLDCWRVSEGILSADDLLYVNVPGGTILLVN